MSRLRPPQPSPSVQRGGPEVATGKQPASAARVASAALTAGGWLLLMLSVPVAIFLTWFGDCFEDTCPSATELDRAVYLFDLVAWLVLPALAFGAYRGWRPAAVGVLVIGVALVAQVVAAVLGARGFQTFWIVFPAGAVLAAAGVIGVAPAVGWGGDERTRSRNGLAGLVVVSILAVLIALQGLIAGGAGAGQGLLLIVAVSLAVIAVLAYLNRERRPPPPGPRRHR